MSLESLFQHIIFTEQQAEESRRLMREVRSETIQCRENIQKATEKLNEEKIKLESKVEQFSERSFLLQRLKTHENALERQYNEITDQRNTLLHNFETIKKKAEEEEEKFLQEITDFNNKYAITNKRELFMKENVKMEISNLENQANVLKMEMKSMEPDSNLLNDLQKQKHELMQELLTLQRKLKGFEDKEKEAVCTTKYLEAEKIKISEKPQNDAECLRLKKELELYKEDDMESIYEALQTEVELLELGWAIWSTYGQARAKAAHPLWSSHTSPHRLLGHVQGLQFCPFEDVLGVGHSAGITSMLVPGTAEPNFDGLENKPYRSRKQRQWEVKILLKIPAELIRLHPRNLGRG
ncbi:PREDICTED: coiled-coil domain-containing protein 172 [Elephantulus edwardii]|uniref:coiled-coil domain-containing protein 172 n=1 Tax=Elephantulus edwardii TaxID=28737 RepID=UPI0003F0AB2A|nr:PREDICTED: coiled-coil domain-containing protein 172 [Elephantulus edwardii]